MKIQKTLEEGKGHRWPGKHQWEIKDSEWDEATMGKRVELIDEYYAIYQNLLQCPCGAKVITREVALI